MGEPIIRPAQRRDLEQIVALLADDPLGSDRECAQTPLDQGYIDAFGSIDLDPNHELAVLQVDGTVAGVLQISFIPSMTYRGGWRAQIEGVRVGPSLRGRGYGTKLFRWSIDRARARGCRMVQLTTDKTRPDALRFYESLGFRASHEGLKLHFPTRTSRT